MANIWEIGISTLILAGNLNLCLSYLSYYNCTLKYSLKFIYSDKATKICEIYTVDSTITTYDKSSVEISQKFVAFSEYINFKVETI